MAEYGVFDCNYYPRLLQWVRVRVLLIWYSKLCCAILPDLKRFALDEMGCTVLKYPIGLQRHTSDTGKQSIIY